MVALVHSGRPLDPLDQRLAERVRLLREQAFRARDGFLPAHVLVEGRLQPLRPLAYPYAELGEDDA